MLQHRVIGQCTTPRLNTTTQLLTKKFQKVVIRWVEHTFTTSITPFQLFQVSGHSLGCSVFNRLAGPNTPYSTLVQIDSECHNFGTDTHTGTLITCQLCSSKIIVLYSIYFNNSSTHRVTRWQRQPLTYLPTWYPALHFFTQFGDIWWDTTIIKHITCSRLI